MAGTSCRSECREQVELGGWAFWLGDVAGRRDCLPGRPSSEGPARRRLIGRAAELAEAFVFCFLFPPSQTAIPVARLTPVCYLLLTSSSSDHSSIRHLPPTITTAIFPMQTEHSASYSFHWLSRPRVPACLVRGLPLPYCANDAGTPRGAGFEPHQFPLVGSRGPS